MDLDVLFWLVLIGIGVVVASRTMGEPSRAFSGMWGFRELVWPEGVQEDDDAHWSWVRASPRRLPESGIVEAEAALPDVGQVTYEVRSVDRARS